MHACFIALCLDALKYLIAQQHLKWRLLWRREKQRTTLSIYFSNSMNVSMFWSLVWGRRGRDWGECPGQARASVPPPVKLCASPWSSTVTVEPICIVSIWFLRNSQVTFSKGNLSSEGIRKNPKRGIKSIGPHGKITHKTIDSGKFGIGMGRGLSSCPTSAVGWSQPNEVTLLYHSCFSSALLDCLKSGVGFTCSCPYFRKPRYTSSSSQCSSNKTF